MIRIFRNKENTKKKPQIGAKKSGLKMEEERRSSSWAYRRTSASIDTTTLYGLRIARSNWRGQLGDSWSRSFIVSCNDLFSYREPWSSNSHNILDEE